MNVTFLIFVGAVLALAGLVVAVLKPRLLQPKGCAPMRAPMRMRGLRRRWRKVYLLPIGIHRLIGWLPGSVPEWPAFTPQVQFVNIAEGTADKGFKSYIPDAAISRFNLVKQGSDDVHVAFSAATTDIPLGVTTDSVDAANLDLPITVGVFGAVAGTLRVVLGGTVAAGDFLQSNGDGTALKLKTTTGSWYKIGRALMAGVSGDTIEFAPCMPDLVVVP